MNHSDIKYPNRILAIDVGSNPMTLLHEAMTVTFSGTLVEVPSTDPEFLTKAREASPEIAFIGIQGSSTPGPDLIPVLKNDPALRHCCVVVISDENADELIRYKALRDGADAFLRTPFDQAELTGLISLVSRLRSAETLVAEKQHLSEEVFLERTRLLREQMEELRNTEKELKKSYADLELTKLAALNLMEDLKAEVDQRTHSETVLKESQEKFKELSSLFRSISDNMTDMLWAKDLDNKYIFTNKSFSDNLLVAENTDEPIGKDDLFFALRQRALHPENPEWHTFGEICRDSDQVVKESGRPEQFDEYGNVKGKFLFLDVRKSPLYDINGRMIGTVGSAQDRTSEREISKQLAQRERQLSTLVSNLSGMVYRCLGGNDGEMLFVSDGCMAITGYTREDFLENKRVVFNDIILDEYRDSVLERWEKVLSLGEMFEGEYPIRTATGEIKWVWERCRGEYGEQGEVLYVEGYIDDVTARMKAVESLRESEQRYETFINSINDFAFLKDENLKYLFINNSNALFFGRSPEEVIGLDDFELMQADYAQNCRDADLRAMQGSGVVVSEEVVDGRIYEARKFPVLLKYGKTGVGGYIRDISNRKAAEEVISKMNDELEQRVRERTSQLESANKELEAFSYSVSHDLRAPLRAIAGFTRILYEDYEPVLDGEGKRLCQVIQENAVRMGQLIDDLLSLSRLNRTDLHLTRINMEHLAMGVYHETTTEEDRHRINFTISNIHAARGDQVLLKQVLVNLISNAVKFSGKRPRAEIAMTSELRNGLVEYCISDNGAGFDMIYSDKLFGAFQRLHSLKEFEGNGIGLAIVQRIIHRHGGKVWAEGEINKGASFYFSLPLKSKY